MSSSAALSPILTKRRWNCSACRPIRSQHTARSAPRPPRRWRAAPCRGPASISRCRSPASPAPVVARRKNRSVSSISASRAKTAPPGSSAGSSRETAARSAKRRSCWRWNCRRARRPARSSPVARRFLSSTSCPTCLETNRELPMLLRTAWYTAAWADEIGEGPLARRICNDPVVLFRNGSGKAAALADRCCHRAAPLHRGSIVDAGIQCGYHGLVFDATGRCVQIPGQRLIPEDARVRAYPAVEKNRLVWLWLGDPAVADPAGIVDFPFHDDPAHWPNKHVVYAIRGNSMRIV